MSVLDIRYLGDPVLRRECEPVEDLDEEVRALIRDMQETMYAADGVGLAAPQVGVPLRVFVYDIREPEHASGVLINPRVEARSGTSRGEEGCLSIPGLSDIVERAERIVITGLDEDGEPVRIEAEGMLSRCLQHEVDHLNGVLFLDHLSPFKRKLLLDKWTKRVDRDEVGAGRS
jgi:peptide deformylase